jgi:asparagine synthase (glutamine-hydrolysing)
VCGIAAMLGGDPRRLNDTVVTMIDAIVHRGPDDWGVESLEDEGVALGMRRLSIVDIAGGHQPMWSSDMRCCVVFNGEIYNAVDLRRELLAKGRRFRTHHSDTEVLVEGWACWGESLFERLNGMFAVAIWDRDARELIVARDRAGEKPLYIARTPSGYAIGSELKAILRCPEVDRTLDLVAVEQFLAFDYIIGPRTPFRDVRKLAAGSFARLTTEQCEEQPFWQPSFDRNELSDAELEMSLDELLDDSVRRRMVADVPLGLFLSGGLDSTAVGYYMRRHSDDVHSFSIGFEEQEFDESPYSSIAASALGTHHHLEVFSQDRIKELVPSITEILDEPMGDQSIFPTFLLSRFTRDHVKVALGGDGSDELWMGYNSFKPLRIAWELGRLPVLAHGMATVARALPTEVGGHRLRGVQFARTLRRTPSERQLALLGSFSGNARWVMSDAACRELPVDVQTEPARRLSGDNGRPLGGADATVAAYLRGYLQEDILVKVDRASMATSLEVRAPFLDPRLIDLALASSPRQRLRGFVGKQPLRRLMRGRIPDALIDRRKQGFGVPLNQWLRESLAPMVTDYLSPARLRDDGLLDVAAVQRLVSEHLHGEQDRGHQIWLLLQLEMWRERWAS